MASGMNHLEEARVMLETVKLPKEYVRDEERQICATIAIAEALTGILELLTGVIGDRGSVVDVRVNGSVSTGDQR